MPLCLLALAHGRRRNGERVRATQLLREGLVLHQQHSHPAEIQQALLEVAALAIDSGDMCLAARMIGASHGSVASANTAEAELWTLVRYADLMDVARSALGDHRFAEVFAVGQALTLDAAVVDAIDYTLSEISFDGLAPSRVTGSPFDLTSRELEVLRLMADGLTDQAIADTLFISRRTVTNHTGSIFAKLNLSSRTAAVAYAIRSGLVWSEALSGHPSRATPSPRLVAVPNALLGSLGTQEPCAECVGLRMWQPGGGRMIAVCS